MQRGEKRGIVTKKNDKFDNSNRGVDGLNEAMRRTMKSTASGGRFDRNVKVTGDKKENKKLVGVTKAPQKKQKVNTSM